MNDPLNLILRCNQLMIRDRIWNDGTNEEKARVIEEQITDLLNPKINPGLAERTHKPLSEDVKKGLNA